MIDPLYYYNLESYLFEQVSKRFQEDGSIGAFDFLSIVIWKANRAKTKIAKRLLANSDSLEEAARKLTSLLYEAKSDEERLAILMSCYGFLLPMASSILSVFWPERFTVYDIRVCEELRDFDWVGNLSKQSKVWDGYLKYRTAVIEATPTELTLRDKDRYLWGRSAASQLKTDILDRFARLEKQDTIVRRTIVKKNLIISVTPGVLPLMHSPTSQ